MPSDVIRQNSILLRLLKDINDIRANLRRNSATLPLYDINNENTPAQLTANQDNYVPGNYDVLKLSSDAERTITGMRGGVKGRFIQLFNSGIYKITLAHESGLSLIGNRFHFGNLIDNHIFPGSSVKLYYDFAQQKWLGWGDNDGSGVLWARQGGDPSVWYTYGTNNYVPSNAIMQGGSVGVVFSGTPLGNAKVTFPVAFSEAPIVFLTRFYQGANTVDFGFENVTAADFDIYWQLGMSPTITLPATWLAIGPR